MDQITSNAKTAFSNLIEQHLTSDHGPLIDYDLTYPKSLFLQYLVHEKGLYLHGSNDKDIDVLLPREATGTVEGQAECAVYATTDVPMALFFAVIDRSRVSFFATRSDPPRFFVAREALSQKPWVEGMVYIFSPDSFESIPGSNPVSYQAVHPVGKLPVSTDDFPFFGQVQAIDRLDDVKD